MYVFLVEAVLKILAMGPKGYAKVGAPPAARAEPAAALFFLAAAALGGDRCGLPPP